MAKRSKMERRGGEEGGSGEEEDGGGGGKREGEGRVNGVRRRDVEGGYHTRGMLGRVNL